MSKFPIIFKSTTGEEIKLVSLVYEFIYDANDRKPSTGKGGLYEVNFSTPKLISSSLSKDYTYYEAERIIDDCDDTIFEGKSDILEAEDGRLFVGEMHNLEYVLLREVDYRNPKNDQNAILRLRDSAGSLFDGGWRSEDHDQIMDEYFLNSDEADIICARLEELAEENGETDDE